MADPNVRPAVEHFPGATPQEKDAVEMVMACVEGFDNGLGQEFRDRCNRFYRQYRGFRRFKDAWIQAGPNDRDGVVFDAKKHWGAHLHIPLSFRTIETMVPRAIAHAPHLLYLPRHPRWEENVDAVRLLINAQQENIDIDLPFQAVMRSGRIYGLGAGKTLWRTEWGSRRRVKPRMFLPSKFYVGQKVERYVEFDDPDFVDVDVFDLMWDPMGSAMRGDGRCGWVVHRNWRDLGYCLDMIRSGTWDSPSAQALAGDPQVEAKLRSMGTRTKYDEVWQDRMEVSGFSSHHLTTRGEQPHELLEWHDGDRVITVLDRQLVVQDSESPCCGMLPFQVYRPTPLQKQLVGIGDLEPLEDLQRELDMLRSQRRDAATLALCAGYVYDDAYIDEEDLVFGPAAAIRARNAGDVRNALFPIPVRDVPGSAWQDEQVIRTDFDAVSGISDALDSSPGPGSTTATEAQLVQAALSRRIQLGSRRFEIEVVRNVARGFLKLNQRMIVENRQPIRQPAAGYDMATAANEGRWQWFDIGPAAISGEFEIIPEGGSMAEKNIPQDRQDAAQIMQLFGQNEYVDPRRPLLKALRLFGEKDPESWLRQSDPPVPPAALQVLQQMGVDPSLIQRAVQVAQASDPQLPLEQQGVQTGDVQQMMAGAS